MAGLFIKNMFSYEIVKVVPFFYEEKQNRVGGSRKGRKRRRPKKEAEGGTLNMLFLLLA